MGLIQLLQLSNVVPRSRTHAPLSFSGSSLHDSLSMPNCCHSFSWRESEGWGLILMSSCLVHLLLLIKENEQWGAAWYSSKIKCIYFFWRLQKRNVVISNKNLPEANRFLFLRVETFLIGTAFFSGISEQTDLTSLGQERSPAEMERNQSTSYQGIIRWSARNTIRSCPAGASLSYMWE